MPRVSGSTVADAVADTSIYKFFVPPAKKQNDPADLKGKGFFDKRQVSVRSDEGQRVERQNSSPVDSGKEISERKVNMLPGQRVINIACCVLSIGIGIAVASASLAGIVLVAPFVIPLLGSIMGWVIMITSCLNNNFREKAAAEEIGRLGEEINSRDEDDVEKKKVDASKRKVAAQLQAENNELRADVVKVEKVGKKLFGSYIKFKLKNLGLQVKINKLQAENNNNKENSKSLELRLSTLENNLSTMSGKWSGNSSVAGNYSQSMGDTSSEQSFEYDAPQTLTSTAQQHGGIITAR